VKTPSATATAVLPRRRGGIRLVWLAVVAGLALLLAANAHLVFVAFTSQPDCVEHIKAPGTDGTYRAAKSAC
jgi:hypothetical protein